MHVGTSLAYLSGGQGEVACFDKPMLESTICLRDLARTIREGMAWKLDFCHKNVRPLLNEDRISGLPDELILHILSCLDTKLAVQLSLLFPRWKLLWTSMPCLNFYSRSFDSLLKLANFVTNVLSRRNHQVQVSSVKIDFHEVGSQVILEEIVNYAFSHNVQKLLVIISKRLLREVPLCLFSSKSLQDLTLSIPLCRTPTTPWDFPALTTLHLDSVEFYDNSVDLFSKCVNLKNLALEKFAVFVQVFVISIPQLSNLRLINGKNSIIVNIIAPHLENLTIRNCSIKKLNAPPGLTSLCYEDYHPPQLPKDCFNSLNKASVSFHLSRKTPYKEIDARETINMLQELHNAKCLTLNLDIVECLSSFPELLSQHPSPFRNMINVNIDSSRKEPYKVKISTATRNFLLANSPRATLIMDLPEEPPTKAMIAKQARKMKMAKQIADVESHMNELQLLLDQENKLAERIESNENKVAVKNLVAELLGWRKKRIMQSAAERAQIDEVVAALLVQIKAHMGEIQDLIKQENHDVVAINSKKLQVVSLLEILPKQHRADIIARYSHQLRQTETLGFRLISGTLISDETNAFIKYVSDNLSTFQDDSSSKPSLVS